MVKRNSVRNRVVRELTPMENELKRKLLTFYNKNIKGSLLPIEQIKLKFNNYITKLIQDTVIKAYGKGTDIILFKIEEFDINQFVKDANQITTITAVMVTAFWRTAQRLLMRETEFKLTQDRELEQKMPFDKNAAMVATAALVVYDSFNSAIQKGPGQVVFTTANDSDVDSKICRPKDGEKYDANAVPLDSQPPLHNHCRCVLVPVEGTEI